MTHSEEAEHLVGEYHVEVVVEELPRTGRHFILEPDSEIRDALAERFGLLSLSALRGEMHVKALAGAPIYRVTGRIEAACEQPCVVTLRPVEQSINEEFELEFAPGVDLPDELDLTLEDDDPCEPIINGKIDLGELLAQQLALALDPYPRASDADLEKIRDEAAKSGREFEVNAGKASPFGALSKLKTEKK